MEVYENWGVCMSLYGGGEYIRYIRVGLANAPLRKEGSSVGVGLDRAEGEGRVWVRRGYERIKEIPNPGRRGRRERERWVDPER